ncbi:YtxH domain-containing protein, partial [Streptococcus agalactiae]|nr:YtxH domain-containing protein [Streptococcus agalactiae]
MSKLFKTLVISAASGVAAAYFLTTKKGKELRKNAEKFYGEYK